MKDITEPSDPTSVDFPSHPDPVTVDHIIELLVVPKLNPNDHTKLVVTFQPIRAESKVPGPTYPPDPSDLYVLNGGVSLFNLYLDDSTSYVFWGKGVTLSSDTPKGDLNYYFDPYFDPRTSTKHVAFMAQYIGDNWAHVDPILLFIKDPRNPLLSSEPTDPDILNPGDHPPKLTSG